MVWKNVFDADASEEETGPAPPELLGRWWVRGRGEGGSARELEVTLHVGDLTAVAAEAVCTSTNPRLSLWGGTGSAVIRRGGWAIKREAAKRVAEETRRAGGDGLEPGTVHQTGGGQLPHRIVLHCVASDAHHRSSPEIVRRCVAGALAAVAAAGCATVAMPVFATGQASLGIEGALRAMVLAFADAAVEAPAVAAVRVVIPDRERAARARKTLDEDEALEARPIETRS